MCQTAPGRLENTRILFSKVANMHLCRLHTHTMPDRRVFVCLEILSELKKNAAP